MTCKIEIRYGLNIKISPIKTGSPRILDINMPKVMESWWIVPTAPLKLNGAISDKNIGAKQAPRPETQHKCKHAFDRCNGII